MANKNLPIIRTPEELQSVMQQWRQKLQPVLNKAQTPAMPVNFKVTRVQGGNQITWAPVSGADGYELLRTATGDFAQARAITIDGARTSAYFDATTPKETRVYYKLRATGGTAAAKHSVKGELTSALSTSGITSASSSTDSGTSTQTGGTGGGAVSSVNGQVGEVVLTTDDVNEGTTNFYYHDALVSALLGTLVLRGAEASRPAAGTAGRLYFTTDTHKTYRDNGTTWDDVSGGFPYPLNTGATPADGNTIQYSSVTGKFELVTDKPTQPTSAVPGQPLVGQLVLIFTCATPMMFGANFAGSVGTCGVNPSATATYTVKKNGVTVGSISIAASGTFTFATAGGATVSLNTGDRLTVTAPNPVDANLSDVGFTLLGTRTSVFAPGTAIPVCNYRGAYSSTATYQPYDLVSYTNSTYFCTATTTGNAPTNTSYWAMFAAKGTDGANGGVQVGQDIGGTTSSPVVVGIRGKSLDTSVGNPSDGNSLVYDGTLQAWKAGAASAGLTGFDFGMQLMNFTGGAGFNSGYWGGVLLIVPFDCQIRSVKFMSTSNSPSTRIYPGIYTYANFNLTTLLATGPQVSGVTAGLNVIPLTNPLSVTAGQLIAVGIVVLSSGINTAACAGYGCCWFSCSGPPPNPASGVGFGNSGWASMWAGVN